MSSSVVARAYGSRALWSLIAFLVVWAWVSLEILPNLAGPTDPIGLRFDFADFRDTMWTPGLDLLAGGLPWATESYQARHPNAQMFPLYSPSYWPVAWLLLQMPYSWAVAAWLGVLTGALVALVSLSLHQFLPKQFIRWPWITVILSCFFAFTPPGKYALYTGNWAVLCAFGAGLVLLLPSHRGAVSGLLLAFVKPQVGLPAAVLAAVAGRWRAVVVAVLVTGLASVPVLWMGGTAAGGWESLFQVLLANARAATTEMPAEVHTGLDIANTVRDFAPAAPSVAVWSIVAIFGVLLGTVFAAASSGRVSRALGAVAGGLFTVLLTPNLSYGALVLIPGIVAVLGTLAAPSGRRGGSLPWWQCALLATLLFPFVNFQRLFPLLGMPLAAGYTANSLSLVTAAIVASLVAVRQLSDSRRAVASTQSRTRLGQAPGPAARHSE